MEDGVHDLWRRTIMKFYSKIFGDLDYSLFEVMHFGLRLPHTLSSFPQTVSASVSDWVTLKSGFEYAKTEKHERITHISKRQLFNQRCHLHTAKNLSPEQLHSLSFYSFWRLFDVRTGHVSKRQREAIVSVTGTGWPSQAQRSHPRHLYYAKHTLYAYMPCLGDRGTDYIDECVETFYNGNWAEAWNCFVSDVDNLWCPE